MQLQQTFMTVPFKKGVSWTGLNGRWTLANLTGHSLLAVLVYFLRRTTWDLALNALSPCIYHMLAHSCPQQKGTGAAGANACPMGSGQRAATP